MVAGCSTWASGATCCWEGENFCCRPEEGIDIVLSFLGSVFSGTSSSSSESSRPYLEKWATYGGKEGVRYTWEPSMRLIKLLDMKQRRKFWAEKHRSRQHHVLKSYNLDWRKRKGMLTVDSSRLNTECNLNIHTTSVDLHELTSNTQDPVSGLYSRKRAPCLREAFSRRPS